MWQHELECARPGSTPLTGEARAWMFFQPVPAKVVLPMPRPER